MKSSFFGTVAKHISVINQLIMSILTNLIRTQIIHIISFLSAFTIINVSVYIVSLNTREQCNAILRFTEISNNNIKLYIFIKK